MPDSKGWTKHEGGNRPRTGDRPLIIRLRCQSREQAEMHPPQPAKWWPRWKHDGGAGDIIEWRPA